MEVRESEAVGVVDDYSVGVGDVDAVLHDGRGEEHVVIIIHKADEDFLKLFRIHLTVTDGHSCVRDILMDERGYLGKVGYAVVHEVYLSVTRHLEVDGIGYYLVSVYAQFGLDGIAVWRRRAYDAHVSCSHQRELERARDGGGRHGERVHVGLQLAQLLLRSHAELLFLVDDEQSEVMPFHRLAYELVRAYENVNLALLQIGKHLACLLGCAGT